MDLKNSKPKRPYVTFLVCLVLAFIGWCIVTFYKDYRVTLDYKIQCYNLPEGAKSVTVSDSVISLTFNQKGINYLMAPFSNKEKILYISVSELIQQKRKVSVYTFSNKEMREFLSHHNFGSELVAVESPEVVTFYMQ